MIEIEIHCPTCSKKGLIEVEENIILNSDRGVSAINIEKNIICPHSFVTYIDRNLRIRDCFLTDFQIDTPEMELEEIKNDKEILSQDLINIHLITTNINALRLTFILRGCFYKKKLLIINNMEALKSQLITFLKYIFQDTFEFDISLEMMDNYRKDKKMYKDFIIIDNNNVFNDKNNTMKPKMIKIERTIVQKFLAERDPKSSLILLRNEIQKVYNLSNEIITFNKRLKENEELTSRKIMDYFRETKNIKIQIQYLDFLIDVISNYFNVKLAMSSRTSDFLGF